MQLERLHGRKTCDFVLRKGSVWKGKTMMIRWLSGPPKKPGIDPKQNALYMGTFASLKLHKSAVKRNRMRRRVREALRMAIGEAVDLPTAQLLVSPRFASLSASFEDIRSDANNFLSALKHGR